MLDADPPPVEGMPGVRDVAGGEHVLRRGPQLLIDDDAVLDLEPRGARKLDSWRHADADHRKVALNSSSRGGAHATDRRVPFERLDSFAEQQLDAVLDMHVAVELPDLGAEDAHVWQLERVDHGHLAPLLAGRGGHLRADPPRSDDDHLRPGLQPRANRIGIGERTEVEEPVELRPRDAEPPRLRPCAQQQPVEGKLSATLQPQTPRPRVDAADFAAKPQLNLLLAVEGPLVDARLLPIGLAPQVILAQRGALVRKLVLGADQHDVPVEPLLA